MKLFQRIANAIGGAKPAVYQQTYNQAGTVQNAETIINNVVQQVSRSRTGLSNRLRLIDRVNESETLRVSLMDRSDTRSSAPFVACLIGLPEDGMPLFVSRFANYELEHRLAWPCDDLGLPDWPMVSLRTLIVELLGKLARIRGRSVTRALEREQLVDLVQTHGRALCFGQMLRPAAYLARPEILEEWFAFFASEWTGGVGDNLLICLLCIDLGGSEEAEAQQLLSKVRDLAQQYDLLVLPPCEAVDRKHLQTWVDQYNAQPEEGEPAYLSPKFVDRVFEREVALRFERVHQGAAREFNLPT